MLARSLLRIYAYVLMVILLAPLVIVFAVSLTETGYMTFPPVGFTLRWFPAVASDRSLMDSMYLSLVLAVLSSVVVTAIGLIASFTAVRVRFPGSNLVETFLTSPRVVPTIILVLGMIFFFHAVGLYHTFLGLLCAHLVYVFPFAFRTLMSGVVSLDVRLEWSARTLGANWWAVFTRVILPGLKASVITSFIFTFISSFNNVTLALFLSAPGSRTLPVELFGRLHREGMTPLVPAFSVLLGLAGIVIFVIVDKSVGFLQVRGAGGE